jgi:cysteine synthase A
MASGTRWASILDTIGNTPLVNVEGVWVKCEFLNPSGSIKARLAKYAIERAEAEGLPSSRRAAATPATR